MKPEEFIREYGVDKARKVVEGAPESASLVFYYFDEVNDELLGPEYYRDNGSQYFSKARKSWGFCLDPQIKVMKPHDALVSVEDLKRLVESVDLVNSLGGLKAARSEAHKDCFVYNQPLLAAIAAYESIYGGVND